MAAQRQRTTESRIHIVYSRTNGDDLGWHVRLQLPRVEGELLSRRSRDGEDAAVLFGAVSNRENQLHLLPDAQREARERVGRADAVAVQADAQGTPTDYARQPIEELRRLGPRVLQCGRHTGRQARGAALSAAAEPEEGSGAVGRLSRGAAAEGHGGLRVPPCLVAR